MLDDVWRNKVERVLVVSNDGDLRDAIKLVRHRYKRHARPGRGSRTAGRRPRDVSSAQESERLSPQHRPQGEPGCLPTSSYHQRNQNQEAREVDRSRLDVSLESEFLT